MKYDIIHELPGRMRVHCRFQHLDPECRIELNRWLSSHNGLVSATLSTKTRNLLVVYAPEVTRESLLDMLDELKLFGIASLSRHSMGTHEIVLEAAVKTCRHQALAIIKNVLLPKPVILAISGWTTVSRAGRLLHLLFQGEIIQFLKGVATCAVLALYGKSIGVYFVVALAGRLLEPAIQPDETAGTADFASDPLPDATVARDTLSPLLIEHDTAAV